MCRWLWMLYDDPPTNAYRGHTLWSRAGTAKNFKGEFTQISANGRARRIHAYRLRRLVCAFQSISLLPFFFMFLNQSGAGGKDCGKRQEESAHYRSKFLCDNARRDRSMSTVRNSRIRMTFGHRSGTTDLHPQHRCVAILCRSIGIPVAVIKEN
jgi:hypothetical protein